MLLGNGCSHTKEQSSLNELVIASANPMSGNSQDFGQMKVKAIQLAFDEVNAAGGIDGKKLRLIVGDDASSPKEAHKLAEQLAVDPSVLAVIGHFNSASTVAARNVYNGAGIPVITDSVKNVITDGTTPYLFRILATDKVEAEQLAKYSLEKLKLKKMAVIYVNNDYSEGMKDYFLESMRRLGGEITTVEVLFEGRTKDFTAELAKIKNSQPDGIFIAGYYMESALVARQAREMGINVPIVGTDAMSSEELIHLGGAAVEGIRFNGFFHSSMQKNGAEKFVNEFTKHYGREPDTYAALAYDSAEILIDAIRKNGGSREGIYAYLKELKDYPGVTGDITFDEHHDVKSKIIILTVKDGRIDRDVLQLD
jgi:branched-chain amino acid transport system substrate-binding protein